MRAGCTASATNGRIPQPRRRDAWTDTRASQWARSSSALDAPASFAQVTAAERPKSDRVVRSASRNPSAWRWRSTNGAGSFGMDREMGDSFSTIDHLASLDGGQTGTHLSSLASNRATGSEADGDRMERIAAVVLAAGKGTR